MKQNFNCEGYELLNYLNLHPQEIEMILEWRNHESVRTFMREQNIISMQEHLSYLDNLKNNKQKFCFLLKEKGAYLGVIELSKITKNSAYIALNKNPHAKHVGAKLMKALECTAANIFKLQLLKLSVLQTNTLAFALYEKSGFKLISKNEREFFMEKSL
ncbi:UDP-4-amino-4,6-dideoxy-N-acetyl-beta-L-altrosamine N-acetyltransferase [bacterium]|nr:UDP-4-amino-4,6-dideoxy-N-acetyl-beta-L-altrosamine N-acetyltransferase [bacterium]MBU1994474.1 UDP-4-amino-4,6-dideoxy-N-acetyl-beta-L-altrosamine N-acetyltransferase [bacterium]